MIKKARRILKLGYAFFIFSQRIYMKKLTTILLLAIGLASSASAHHMAQSDTAGVNIPDSSPHLFMTFY